MEGFKKEVILVTGSSGCLGQHVIKLLQELDDTVKEIRCYDWRKYVNTLGYRETKPIVEFQEDVRFPKKMHEAMEGVDVVIHCAGWIDLNLIPDRRRLQEINIDATQLVIEECLKNNVSRLIFASTTAVVCGSEHIFFGVESTTPIPKTFMLGEYAESKLKAENLVLEAAGQVCEDGQTILKTVALRPTPFYGVNDRNFIMHFLKFTEYTHGQYYRIRSLDERLQITYVGNVAWAFIKAKEKLNYDDTISGEAFFITDDTPIISIHSQVKPYLEAHGFGVSSWIIPYWFAWIIITLVCLFWKFINFWYIYKVDVLTVNMLNYMCSTFFYNRSKATLRLDYEPIYNPEEARVVSYGYYARCQIKSAC